MIASFLIASCVIASYTIDRAFPTNQTRVLP
jgi:hypothetical protein